MPQNTPQDEWSQYAVKDAPQEDEWAQYAVKPTEKKSSNNTTKTSGTTSQVATDLSSIVGKTVTDGKFTGTLRKDGNDFLIGEVKVDASKVKEVVPKDNNIGGFYMTPSMPKPKGLLQSGNIDIYKQPSVKNPEGGYSTVDAVSFNINGKEVLLSRVTPDGRVLSEQQALDEYKKTGKHLGIFDNPDDATAYSIQLHNDYANGKIKLKSPNVGGEDYLSKLTPQTPDAIPKPLSGGNVVSGGEKKMLTPTEVLNKFGGDGNVPITEKSTPTDILMGADYDAANQPKQTPVTEQVHPLTQWAQNQIAALEVPAVRQGLQMNPVSYEATKSYLGSIGGIGQGIQEFKIAAQETNPLAKNAELMNSLVQLGFSGASLIVPQLQAFNASTQAAQDLFPPVAKALAPASSILEYAHGKVNYKGKLYDLTANEGVKAGAALVDLLYNIAIFHGLGKVGEKIKSAVTLNPEETQQLHDAVDEAFKTDVAPINGDLFEKIPKELPDETKLTVYPTLEKKAEIQKENETLNQQKQQVIQEAQGTDEAFKPITDKKVEAIDTQIADNEKKIQDSNQEIQKVIGGENKVEDISHKVNQVKGIAENFASINNLPTDNYKIYQIGSRATGKNRPNSDWDWMVVGEGFGKLDKILGESIDNGEPIMQNGRHLTDEGGRFLSLDKDVLPHDILFSETPPTEGAKLVYDNSPQSEKQLSGDNVSEVVSGAPKYEVKTQEIVDESGTKKWEITLTKDGKQTHGWTALTEKGRDARIKLAETLKADEESKLVTQQPKPTEETNVTNSQSGQINPAVPSAEPPTGGEIIEKGAKTEEKPQEASKSKLQLAREKAATSLKAANEYRKTRGKNLGVIKDGQDEIKKQAHLDREAFDNIVDFAREAVNEGIKNVADFAKELGESVTDLVQKAWDVVAGEKDYNEAVKEVEAASEEKVNERKFGKQILKSDEVSPDVKAEVQKNLEYVQRGNQLTVNEAKDLIDKIGDEEAYNLVTQGGDVHPATRVVMGEVLIKKFSDLAAKATDENAKNYYLDKAIDTANFVMEKLGTEAGQSIQAFSLFSRLSPEAQLRAASKNQAKIAKNKINKAKKNVDKIGDRFKDANKEAVDVVLESKPVKAAVEKTKSDRTKKAEQKKQKAKAKRTKAIEEWRKSLKGRISGTVTGLTEADFKVVKEIATSYVEEGIADIQIIADKIAEIYKDITGKLVSDEMKGDISKVADDQLRRSDVKLIGGALKDLNVKVSDVVRKHYTVAERVKTDLAKKLVDDAGLDGDEAKELAQKVQESFDRVATRKKQAILAAEKKRFDRVQEKLKSGKKVEPKALQDEIIRYTNLGAFDNADLADVIAKKLGTDRLTPEQANEIIRLSNRIQTAPEGQPKRDATEDLLAYRAKLAGTSVGEVVQGVWYANVLSGYQTQERNAVGNFFNAAMDLGVEATEHPALLPYLLSGMVKGIGRRGIPEALNTLTTGRSPIHISKIEAPTILERTKFTGGKFNPYNYLKYVMRAMTAVDVISFQGLKEARATQLAFRQARAEGLNPYSKQAWHRVNEILLNTRDRYEAATEQVKQEGLSGQKAKRRIWELMEQNRPQDMVDDSYGFAAKGTFNHETEGSLGAVTDAFARTLDINVRGTRPLRFIVPFTRIVTNVVNRGLDYSPIGAIRAIRGKRGFEGSEKYKVMTPEERMKTLKRFAIGTTLTAGLGALAQMGYLQITGGGTGNYKKDEQLKASGWQPYSLKIGDKYYSYQYTPLMINLSLLGNYFDNEKYGLYSDETALRKMELAAWQTMSAAANMTWVGSTAGLLSAFSEDTPAPTEKKITKALGNVAKGLAIPNIYTQTARQVEEVNGASVKQTNDLYDKMIQDVPIARNKLNDRLNALGEPIPVDASIFISNTKHNKYWDFLNQHGIWVGVPNKSTILTFDQDTQQDRPITDDEYYNLIKYRGQEIKDAIDEIQDNGIWVDSNDPKRAFIKKPEEAGEFENISLDEATKTQLQRAISTISRQATMGAKKEVFNPE